MKRRLAVFLFGLVTASCVAQSTCVRSLLPRYAVGAANHDPSARTLQDIFAVNQRLAKEGNTDAAFELALAYLQGYGTGQNLTQAEHWFRIGATTADEKAIVARLYCNGDYFNRNLDTATEWYKSAGRPSDFFELAQGYRTSIPPMTGNAAALYVEISKATDPVARLAKLELGNLGSVIK
jgi:TPR repeat protein